VLEAGGGAEATAVAGRHPGPIHLLITDVVMPDTSGRVLAESLVAARPEMTVLYMSGYTDDVMVHRGVLQKGVVFIAKPFTSLALLRRVREALGEGADGGEA
jgi:FixJ family two-component response regulator